MKIKINWTELGKQLWEAVKPVLLGAIGGGIIGYTTGCSSLSNTPRGQTTEIVAVGVPAIAWISHTSQDADHRGGDTNCVTQLNPVTTPVNVNAK